MKIALIAPPWAPIPPSLYGGIELVIDLLARGLQDVGHEVVLFTTGDSTSPVHRRWLLPEAEGMRLGIAVPEIRHVMAAYEDAYIRSCDVIHDHTVLGPVYAMGLHNLKVVTTIHGPFNEELTEVYQRVTKRVPLIAISNAQRQDAPGVPVVKVIHHGIEASAFPFGKGDGGYCLFLGRMSPAKGAHTAALVASQAKVPLKMVGKMRETGEIEYFKNQVEPYLSSDIEYLGEVPHEEKVELLANAMATLFPIRWAEPFGMVMLESFACGTPVLAFPYGSAPEVIENGVTGFLCADETDMSERLKKIGILDRTKCREVTENYFSVERMTAEHIELFKELISL
ncbi:MAG: glycosyltransferase family 4 protein [Actinobacteria bacterium]|nr:glycosyltransferase family 4 protein [Actinomycetota bacterium]MCL6104446.1 glycosyltransferase family 4 protein [Actinomycetota bacterium]